MVNIYVKIGLWNSLNTKGLIQKTQLDWICYCVSIEMQIIINANLIKSSPFC
jgi:hypothetical protein